MTDRTTMNANAEDRYLRDVGKRLRALTPEQRDAVLDDVRSHFADAAEAGRSPEQAVESLGDPATFTERVRAELGHDSGRTDRIGRALQWLATGVAVFTAMFVTFLLPDDTLGTQFEEQGFEIVLLHLIPALIAALPILVPARVRTVATAAAAIVLTVVSFTSSGSTHLEFFLPTAMLAWAALVTPVLARNGRPTAGWRISAGVLTALPGVWLLTSLLVGSFGTDVWGLLWVAASFVLGALFIVDKAWAGVVLAVGGAALLVLSTLDPGMIVLAFWWAGGLFLTVGVSHALSYTPPRPTARV